MQAGLDHPLPDGNKRAAWASLVMFLELNGGAWDPDPPDVDQAEEAMIAVAAHQRDEAWLAGWLRHRVRLVGAGRALTDVATPSSDAVADKVSAS